MENGFLKVAGLLLLASSCFAQVLPDIGGYSQAAAGGGAGNNVTVVHSGGTDTGGSSSATLAYNLGGNTVTSGNVIFVGVASASGAHTFASGDLTKTAGTSTIGTVVLDQAGSAHHTAIYRVPITGTGTITLTINNGVSDFLLIGAAECSGVNATPLDTHNTATGTSATASSGSISSATPGIIIYVSTEISTTDWTRVCSDSVIYSDANGASSMTGVMQYKLITSSPNTLTDTKEGSVQWYVDFAMYKSS